MNAQNHAAAETLISSLPRLRPLSRFTRAATDALRNSNAGMQRINGCASEPTLVKGCPPASALLLLVIALAVGLPFVRVWPAIIPTPFIFTNIKPLTDGNIQVTYNGPMNANYRLWATTNITASPVQSTWTPLTNSTMTVSPATFTDTQATNFPQRFYFITSP